MFLRRTAIAAALAVITAIGMAVPSDAAPEQEPVLTKVSILFHTNDDNKDHDTEVYTRAYDNAGHQVAVLIPNFGGDTWDDHEDEGPYDLRIDYAAGWFAMKSGEMIIWIEPDGNDTWKFNATATFFFSNGDRRRAETRNQSLDQDRRSVTLPIV